MYKAIRSYQQGLEIDNKGNIYTNENHAVSPSYVFKIESSPYIANMDKKELTSYRKECLKTLEKLDNKTVYTKYLDEVQNKIGYCIQLIE